MANTRTEEPPLLTPIEVVRLRIKQGADLLIASIDERGVPTMTPSEADELAGLMIGVAYSAEAVAHVEYASQHHVAAVDRMDTIMAKYVDRIDAAIDARQAREAIVYAREFGVKKHG